MRGKANVQEKNVNEQKVKTEIQHHQNIGQYS